MTDTNLEHVLERRLGRLPLALGLAEAQVAERRADVDRDRSANRVLGVGHGEGVVLGEGRVGLLSRGDGGRDVVGGGAAGGGGRRGDLEVGHGGGGLGLVGADGHCVCVCCRVGVGLVSRGVKRSVSLLSPLCVAA